MIQSKYWSTARDRGLSSNEILVELFLITCPNCGPAGGFMMGADTIAYHIGLECSKVTRALKGLELKDRIKIYPGDWVFVIGKWEYEGTNSPKLLEALKTEIACFPDALKREFKIRYPETFDKLPDTLSPKSGSSRKGKERKGVGKEKKDPAAKPPGKSNGNSKAKGNPVKIWVDLMKEIREDVYKPNGPAIGNINHAFKHLNGDAVEFEKRVRLYLSSEYVKLPTPAKFYNAIENYKVGSEDKFFDEDVDF